MMQDERTPVGIVSSDPPWNNAAISRSTRRLPSSSNWENQEIERTLPLQAPGVNRSS
ncbi:hypothetical protein [Paenibacillus ehimensis]|uniref:hypothetical protein n=1 Tax=Paenibacillus ehimensis TaxID=79264 RepID=UPI0013E37B44|nr:hypothetical protein [Paenibacillus ehimensis]